MIHLMHFSVWTYVILYAIVCTFLYGHTHLCMFIHRDVWIIYGYVSGISRDRMIVRMFMHFNVWPYFILYAVVGQFCMTIHLYVCSYTFAPPPYYIICIFYMGMHYYVCSYTFLSYEHTHFPRSHTCFCMAYINYPMTILFLCTPYIMYVCRPKSMSFSYFIMYDHT